MKKNLKYLAYLMPLIFFSSVSCSAKASINKSTINKVTVIELDEDNTLQSLSYERFIPRKNLRKDLPVFNRSSDYISIRKQKGDITKPNMILPSNYGSFNYPHTTSLVDSKSAPLNNSSKHAISSSKPYNAVGKILMVNRKGRVYSTCSGALIGKAVVSTAASCLADYGLNNNAEEVHFIPAATSDDSGPIGTWEADKLYIPACYKKGNCESHSEGIINANNIALFTLKKNKIGQTPYDRGAHYLNYGWNNAGFTDSKDNFRIINVKKRAQISTLGYPEYLGRGENTGGSMIRTDSLAFVNIEKSKSGFGNKFEEYVWGSSKSTEGSDGSPIIINLGYQPFYDTWYLFAGKYTTPNVVVGNLGWAYMKTNRHVQGGSSFGQNASYPDEKYIDDQGINWGAGNIGFLMRKVCGYGQRYDHGQHNGICLKKINR